MIGTVCRAHLRLALRDWAIWVTTALTLTLARLVGSIGLINVMGAGSGPGLLLPVFLLGLMLSAAGAAQRDSGTGLSETLEALPYRPTAWVAGRLLALCVPWLAAATLVLGFAALQGAHPGGAVLHPLAVWIWTATVPIGVFFAAAIGWSLGTLFPRGFAPQLLAVFLAVNGALPFLYEILSDMAPIYPLTVFDWTLSNFFAFSPFGHAPDGYLLLMNRLLLVGLGICGPALTVWWLARRGRRPGAGPSLAVAVGGGALAVVAVLVSTRIWADRMANYRAELDAYSRQVAAPTAQVPGVTRYDLRLNLEPSRHRMDAEAVLHVSSAGETAAFTLRRNFSVGSVTGPGGESVAFTREGDWLVLDTKSRPGDYTVRYSGVVWQWRPYARMYTMWLAAHIAGNTVMLPSNYGWYPIPGSHQLSQPGDLCKGACGRRLVDLAVEHAPATFSATVSGMGGRPVITNATGEGTVTSAWLIVTPPAEWQTAEGMGQRLQADLNFYQQLWPLDRAPVMLELPETLWYGRERQYLWSSAYGFRGALLYPTGVWEMGDSSGMQLQLFHAWWGEPRTPEESVIQKVLWAFSQEIIAGEDGKQLGRIALLTVDRKGTAHSEALERLRQHYATRGPGPAGELLRRLHGEAAARPLTWQTVMQVISEASQ